MGGGDGGNQPCGKCSHNRTRKPLWQHFPRTERATLGVCCRLSRGPEGGGHHHHRTEEETEAQGDEKNLPGATQEMVDEGFKPTLVWSRTVGPGRGSVCLFGRAGDVGLEGFPLECGARDG